MPLTEYRIRDPQGLEVFKLTGHPSFSPIDIDLEALIEEFGWGASDRVRLWYIQDQQKLKSHSKILRMLSSPPPHLLVRKIDIEEDCFVHCSLFMTGEVQILSNDENFARKLFIQLFIDVPPSFHKRREWKVEAEWCRESLLSSFFMGTLHSALGWGSDKIPSEINESIFEAMQNLETRNYRSCVVMCRQAAEAILKLAYMRFFRNGTKKELDLYGIIRRFQKEKPEVIPRHWLYILDAVRNIGNVPGAHPEKISHYRFSKSDAALALNNIMAFTDTYFNKIDKGLTTLYTLSIDLSKTKTKKLKVKKTK